MSVTGHQILFSHGKFYQRKSLILGWKQCGREMLSTSSFTQFVSGTIFTDFKWHFLSFVWVGTDLNGQKVISIGIISFSKHFSSIFDRTPFQKVLVSLSFLLFSFGFHEKLNLIKLLHSIHFQSFSVEYSMLSHRPKKLRTF